MDELAPAVTNKPHVIQTKNQSHKDDAFILKNSYHIEEKCLEMPMLPNKDHTEWYLHSYKEKHSPQSKDDASMCDINLNLKQHCGNSFISSHAETYPKYRIKKINQKLIPIKLNAGILTEEGMDYEPLDFIQSEDSLNRSNSLRKNSSGSSTPHKYTDYAHLLHNILLLTSFNSLGNEDDEIINNSK